MSHDHPFRPWYYITWPSIPLLVLCHMTSYSTLSIITWPSIPPVVLCHMTWHSDRSSMSHDQPFHSPYKWHTIAHPFFNTPGSGRVIHSYMKWHSEIYIHYNRIQHLWCRYVYNFGWDREDQTCVRVWWKAHRVGWCGRLIGPDVRAGWKEPQVLGVWAEYQSCISVGF